MILVILKVVLSIEIKYSFNVLFVLLGTTVTLLVVKYFIGNSGPICSYCLSYTLHTRDNNELILYNGFSL